MSYRVTDVRMDEALRAADALVLPHMQNRGIAYHYTACHRGIVARADRDRVQQILHNLLSNAAKFTPAGKHVTLRCSADEDTACRSAMKVPASRPRSSRPSSSPSSS